MRSEQVTRFVNGSVFTGVRERPWVEAVALRGSRVAVVGSLADVVEQTPDAVEVDLDGRTLLPGLIDAHNHFLATGESLAAISLQQLRPTTKQQLLDIVREAALNTPAGDEITLSGLDPAKLGGGLPTRWELDEAAPQHRVVAYHVSGHGVLVNSRVLAEVELDDFAADPGRWLVLAGRSGTVEWTVHGRRDAARHPERGGYRCAWTELPRKCVGCATCVRGRACSTRVPCGGADDGVRCPGDCPRDVCVFVGRRRCEVVDPNGVHAAVSSACPVR